MKPKSVRECELNQGLAICILMLLGGCGNFPIEEFESLCRREGRIEVIDEAAWQDYLAALREFSIRHEWDDLRISPITGFRFESEFTRGQAFAQKGRPERNNVFIRKEGRTVATITDYWVYQGGFDGGSHVTCTNTFPDIYLPQPTNSRS